MAFRDDFVKNSPGPEADAARAVQVGVIVVPGGDSFGSPLAAKVRLLSNTWGFYNIELRLATPVECLMARLRNVII